MAINPVNNKIYLANPAMDSVTVADAGTDHAGTTVLVGKMPQAVAVNTTTNRVYVANGADGTLSVIDGFGDQVLATVKVGANPYAIAVNEVTNRIYVANTATNDVTVIDGLSNTPTTFPAGLAPVAVAVNPRTNKIYVANAGNIVTVIDGNDNATAPVTTAPLPIAIAVNVVTNKIYVNSLSGSITVIDGATNTPNTFPAALNGVAIAVNPITNQIYGANRTLLVTVDGATNAVTKTPLPFIAVTVAVNALTNQVYVAGRGNSTTVPQVNAAVLDAATNTLTQLSAPNSASIMALNPATNRVYLAGANATSITVLDGAANTPVTIAMPRAIASAVNPVTNRVYALNPQTHTVTVVDGATGSISNVLPLAAAPLALAVNPLMNKIYVASSDNTVTVIDGITNATSVVHVGNLGTAVPHAIAVDIVTNHIYVANQRDGNVSIIDGTTNAVTTLGTGQSPTAVAVNPTTGRAYVACGDGTVTVIDGKTLAVLATAPVGAGPVDIVVNPRTNQIYVANTGTGDLTVFDGTTNAGVNIPLDASPNAIDVDIATNRVFAGVQTGVDFVDPGTGNTLLVQTPGGPLFYLTVDQSTHKVYAANFSGSVVDIVDGFSGALSTAIAGIAPIHVAVNPVDHRVYAASNSGLTMVTDNPSNPTLLTATATVRGPNRTTIAPKFPANASAPAGSAVQAVYFQVDNVIGPWTAAPAAAGQFTVNAAPKPPGMHILYTFATDGQDATSVNTGAQSAPFIGNITATPFFVAPPGTPDLLSIAVPPSVPVAIGFPVHLTAVGSFSDGSQRNLSAEVSWASTNPAVAVPDETGNITALSAGSSIFTASVAGLTVAAPVTAFMPVFSVTAVPAGPVASNATSYTLSLRITNTGNVPVGPVGFTSIVLNTIAPQSLIPAVSMLAPGNSVTFPFTFPHSAGAPGTRAVVRVSGSYTAVLPGGATQPETFNSTSRITLP